MRDRVWSDTPGAGLEVTRFLLLCIPGKFVGELFVLNLRIRCQGCHKPTHISLSGPRWSHNTAELLQYGDDNSGREYSHNNKVVRVCLETVSKHDAFDRVVDSGRVREKMEWGSRQLPSLS